SRARAIVRDGASDFGLALLALFQFGRGGLLTGATLLFGAHELRAFRFESRCFGGSLLARLGRGLRGGDGGGLLFRGGLNVGGFSATTRWRLGGGRNRRWFRGGDGRATTSRGRGGRGLLFGARALFALPPGSDACNLIVREHAHV